MNKFFSRKFISYFTAMSSITTIMMTAMLSGCDMTLETASFLIIGMITIGSISIGYILGQASLEKYLTHIKNS